MNSAALLADAGYSLSGKHALPITCPSPLGGGLYHSPLVGATPFGLKIFEAVKRRLVSILVIAGALGLGAQSPLFLLSVLSETALSRPTIPLQTTLLDGVSTTAATQNLPGLGLIAVHSYEHMLDLNAEQYGGSHARCK